MIICSPQLGLSPRSVLGGEVFDREILLGLAKKGAKIQIILPKGKPHDKNINNWHLSYLPIKHFPAILANVLYLPLILSSYKKQKFDILRLHQPQFLLLNAIIIKAFYPNVRVVATYHQLSESNFGPISKRVNNLWDAIVCDSNNVKRKLINKYEVNPKKIFVVHNGAPKYLKPSLKDKAMLKKLKIEKSFILTFMGLLIDRKNPTFLLYVLKEILKKQKNIVLIYWGQGPMMENIIEKAKALGVLPNIRFQDPIYGKSKSKIHNLTDVFVHPSLDEGFALAPLEAMACEKPVLVNNQHSAHEIVKDNLNGFICKTNNIADWSDKIMRLVNNHQLRKKMGENALKIVKKEFNWDIAIKIHHECFKKIL